tara:strand:+ start:2887 stop:3102 length:216 start_codon:yes stop_codon:yes gene_type:complete
MELNEQQKEEVVIKLGVLCHLLESAAQVMQEITKIASGAKQEEIEKLIADHTAEGIEMISKFLDEANENNL